MTTHIVVDYMQSNLVYRNRRGRGRRVAPLTALLLNLLQRSMSVGTIV